MVEDKDARIAALEAVLLHHELAEERFPGILHLTLAGRAALQEVQE